MIDRLTTFVGITAIFYGAFLFAIGVAWGLLSFSAWHLFGPPPWDLLRFLFGVCALGGAICALCCDDSE